MTKIVHKKFILLHFKRKIRNPKVGNSVDTTT